METVKSFTLEPGGHFTTKDFEELEGVQTLDTAITDMSAWSVNYWLSKFIREVNKKNILGSAILPLRYTQLFAD